MFNTQLYFLYSPCYGVDQRKLPALSQRRTPKARAMHFIKISSPMVRITNKGLLIEIETTSPHEQLYYLQQAYCKF